MRNTDYRQYCALPADEKFFKDDVNSFFEAFQKKPFHKNMALKFFYAIRRYTAKYGESKKLDTNDIKYVYDYIPRDRAENVDEIDWTKVVHTSLYPYN